MHVQQSRKCHCNAFCYKFPDPGVEPYLQKQTNKQLETKQTNKKVFGGFDNVKRA